MKKLNRLAIMRISVKCEWWVNDNESSVIWYQIGCGRRASASGASGSCANMSESVKINQARDTGHSTNYPNPNRGGPAKGPRQLGAVSRQKAWQRPTMATGCEGANCRAPVRLPRQDF